VRGEWIRLALLTPQLFVMIAMALCIGPAFDALDVAQGDRVSAFVAVGTRRASRSAIARRRAPRRPALVEIVDEVARAARRARARVWVVDWPCVNALALPWSRQLALHEALPRDARPRRDRVHQPRTSSATSRSR
jgi:hypothetical protein